MITLSSAAVHRVLIAGLVVLQSTVFRYGIVSGVVPDVALLVLVFSANYHGSFRGQVTGFVAGIVQDLLSLAPLGFHAFIRTLTGFLYGMTRGKLFVDPIFVPILLAGVATLMKALLSFILFGLFSPDYASSVFTPRLAVELGLNCVLAPFVCGILRAAGLIRVTREGV